MPAVPLGFALGVLNVFAIAIAMAGRGGEPGIAVWVIAIGTMPGLVVGTLLGWLAEVIAPLPVSIRRLVLAGPAMFLVIVLAALLSQQQYISLAIVPTAVAALLLERGTRQSVATRVPFAQARRGA